MAPGVICINGAAAHLNKPGDLVILATFAELDEAEARAFKPPSSSWTAKNRIVENDAVEVRGAGAAGFGMTVFLWRR